MEKFWPRVFVLVLLAFFLLICGIHVSGVHHNSDSHGLTLAIAVNILSRVALAVARRASIAKDPRLQYPAPPPASVVPASFQSLGLVTPLRC